MENNPEVVAALATNGNVFSFGSTIFVSNSVQLYS